jgi:hypothetical protein
MMEPDVTAGHERVGLKAKPLDFLALHRADPIERIRIVKLGLPATTVETMAKCMDVQKSWLAAQLGIARPTVSRRARDNKPLGAADSEHLLGMARLVGQVQQMVNESGKAICNFGDIERQVLHQGPFMRAIRPARSPGFRNERLHRSGCGPSAL